MTTNGSRPRTIAVVGGGASGTLVAGHLLRRWNGDLRVYLIERREELGQGVAYSTRSTRHLLNVPASKMSALPDDPNHFLRWLRVGPMPGAMPETFAPRPLFHAYLLDALKEAESLCPQASLERVRGEVVSVKAEESGATVGLRDGRGLRADRVVLALGNLPPRNPRISDGSFYSDPRYVPDAWASGVLDGVSRDEPVLLVGTSLTAIDVAISLQERGHRAVIHAVSRRGLVPNPHRRGDPFPPYPAFVSADDPGIPSVSALVRRVRREIRRAEAAGHDWRGVVEALRPETQPLWGAMPDDERRRFVRHLQPYWEVHRHRIAPEVGDAVAAMRREDKLAVVAGRVRNYDAKPDGINVTIGRRGGGERVVRVGRVINCTAPGMDPRATDSPLVHGLLEDGLVRPGTLGIGLDTEASGALLGADGAPSPFLYTLGGLLKGRLWETIAVPEIRTQATDLAEELLRDRTDDPATRTAVGATRR